MATRIPEATTACALATTTTTRLSPRRARTASGGVSPASAQLESAYKLPKRARGSQKVQGKIPSNIPSRDRISYRNLQTLRVSQAERRHCTAAPATVRAHIASLVQRIPRQTREDDTDGKQRTERRLCQGK